LELVIDYQQDESDIGDSNQSFIGIVLDERKNNGFEKDKCFKWNRSIS
jgi:hypothetical protein